MDMNTVVLFAVAGMASLFMAWVIGAGSSGATPFAPAVGANAISTMRAAFVVGILGLLGAVFQGANVTAAVGSGLIRGVELTPMAVIFALGIAAGLMAVGIRTGYPIATAFTVTGAVIGSGLALGGLPAWDKYGEIAAMWVIAPIVNGALAYGLASMLPRNDVPERWSVPALAAVTGVVIALVEFSFLGPSGVSQSLSGAGASSLEVPPLAITVAAGSLAAAVVWRWLVVDEERGLRRYLLALGGLVAFSAGGSQVGLAVGPLVPLLESVDISLTVVLAGGGVGILVGSWTGAPRMIKSLSKDYASLGPRRSISALLPTFLLAQLAVFLGVPISFNEAIVTAIIGSGAAVGGESGISREKLTRTVGAWTGSFAFALALGFGAFALV